MEYGFLTHVLLWVVGAVALIGAVGTTLAFWSMGRSYDNN